MTDDVMRRCCQKAMDCRALVTERDGIKWDLHPEQHAEDLCVVLAQRWLAEHPADDAEPEPFDVREFLRKVLDYGAAVQAGFAAGPPAGYETYSDKLDAWARTFAEELKPHLRRPS